MPETLRSLFMKFNASGTGYIDFLEFLHFVYDLDVKIHETTGGEQDYKDIMAGIQVDTGRSRRRTTTYQDLPRKTATKDASFDE